MMEKTMENNRVSVIGEVASEFTSVMRYTEKVFI